MCKFHLFLSRLFTCLSIVLLVFCGLALPVQADDPPQIAVCPGNTQCSNMCSIKVGGGCGGDCKGVNNDPACDPCVCRLNDDGTACNCK